MMTSNKNFGRREFIGTTAKAAASLAIVPSHVIAGLGKIPPSDQITVVNIGCGTQGLREMGGLLKNPRIRVVAVCDSNKYSEDYIDWSPYGIRDSIRETLGDSSWGATMKGIPGGRDVGQEYVDNYYRKSKGAGTSTGCNSYEDFRELYSKEKDIDVVKVMTPDHTHASIAIAAMDQGIHVVTHKPISNRLLEGRKVIEKAKSSGVITHLLAWSDRPEYRQMKAWIEDGQIGQLTAIHNWSYRPVWQQWTKRPSPPMPVPKGFNWELWLGPVPDMPYHKNYTHNVFRGWYDFGGGSVADMGHYSLFPLFETLGINSSPVETKAYGTTTREEVNGVYQWVDNDVAFPASCMIKWKFPEQDTLPPFDLYWYDGGMKPFAPKELEQDGLDTPDEGLMLVGTSGIILGGFRGENPVLLPKSKMASRPAPETIKSADIPRLTDMWVDAILEGKQTPGSFIQAKTITDTVNLGAVALRTKKKIGFDEVNVKITNEQSANEFLTRNYRPGWEI